MRFCTSGYDLCYVPVGTGIDPLEVWIMIRYNLVSTTTPPETFRPSGGIRPVGPSPNVRRSAGPKVRGLVVRRVRGARGYESLRDREDRTSIRGRKLPKGEDM